MSSSQDQSNKRCHMAMAKRLGLVLLGMALGMVLTRTVGTLSAQQDNTPPRLLYTRAANTLDGIGTGFIRDVRTNACWLRMGTSIAPAPNAACQETADAPASAPAAKDRKK